MRAAEEPSPVLCTSDMCTPVGRNGGSCFRESMVGGRFREESWDIDDGQSLRFKAESETYLCSLRIEIIITKDCDIEIM